MDFALPSHMNIIYIKMGMMVQVEVTMPVKMMAVD